MADQTGDSACNPGGDGVCGMLGLLENLRRQQ